MVGNCASACDLGGGSLAGLDLDVVLAKFTSAGAHVWSKRFAGNTNPDQYPSRVVLGPTGAIHVGGFFGASAGDATIDFGGGPLVAEGSQPSDHDAFVATFDSAGAHVWSKRFGDPDATRASGLACDDSGDVIVGGTLDGTVDFGGGPLSAVGGNDVFVVRLDAAGNHVWSKRFGAAGSQAALDLALSPAGVIHVVGRFGGSLDFGGGALLGAGNDDGFVASLDGAGQHLASRRFGDACSQFVREVATDANGNVAIAGEVQSPGTIDSRQRTAPGLGRRGHLRRAAAALTGARPTDAAIKQTRRHRAAAAPAHGSARPSSPWHAASSSPREPASRAASGRPLRALPRSRRAVGRSPKPRRARARAGTARPSSREALGPPPGRVRREGYVGKGGARAATLSAPDASV